MKNTTERTHASSPRPEQPTILPTSYTTSWDLTLPRASFIRGGGAARSRGRRRHWSASEAEQGVVQRDAELVSVEHRRSRLGGRAVGEDGRRRRVQRRRP